MIPSFDHLPSLDHDDIISMADGLESVSDNDDRSSLEEGIEGCCDLLLTEWIKGWGGLIEEDDLRVFQKYFCDSESLFLSSGESHSSFPDLSIESVFKIEYEITMSEMKGSLKLTWVISMQ